jgi:hypothetical protein
LRGLLVTVRGYDDPFVILSSRWGAAGRLLLRVLPAGSWEHYLAERQGPTDRIIVRAAETPSESALLWRRRTLLLPASVCTLLVRWPVRCCRPGRRRM